MTPIWKKYAKGLAQTRRPGELTDMERRFLAVEQTFDMSAVSDLCRQVANELSGGQSFHLGIFDLGERCVMPAERFWVEFDDVDFFVETCVGPDSGLYILSTFIPARDGRKVEMVTLAQIEQADDLFLTGIAKMCPVEYEDDARDFRGYFLGALAVLNSPRARRERGPSRKTGLNKYPTGVNPELRETKIYIDVGGHGRTASTQLAHASSPKAYHFVRAHVRRFVDGSSTDVRAHWRGDPAFGIRIGSYVVRDCTLDAAPARLETVH